jgi:hypothetical protein
MMCVQLLVLLTSNVLILCSSFELFGQLNTNLRRKRQLLSLLLLFIVIIMIKKSFLLVLLGEMAVLKVILKKKSCQKDAKHDWNELFLAEELILTIKTGISLENALRKLSERDFRYQILLSNTDSASTNDLKDTSKLVSLIKFARKNSSVSLKALIFFRESEKLRKKLQSKQKNITLQAKAQAVVSIFIYLALLIAQFLMSADFQKWIFSTSGRFVFILSAGLLAMGVFCVFKMAEVKELEL